MDKKKCYTYTRVSTAAQIEGYSLEAQKEKLRRYADYKGFEIAGEYCDAGKSGHSVKGRPAFMEMMDDIISGKDGIAFVLVFKLSRFGRNAADVLKSMQLLMDYDVDLVCVEDSIDSSTQGGRLTLAILSAVAEIERENITVQFMSGRIQRLKDGKWPGGPAPYGYRIQNKELVIAEEEAKIVKLIYDTYLQEDMMINSVATYLNEHGYRRMADGKPVQFNRDTVARILSNPVYCGRIYFNRRTNDKPPNRKPKEALAYDGIHEIIVTKEQWNAVQEKRKRNYRKRESADNPERISLLSGLVKCPICGMGMVHTKNKKSNPNHGGYYKILHHYVCTNHRMMNGRTCDFNRIYNQEKLDGAVLEVISRITATQEFKDAFSKAVGDRTLEESYEENLKKLRRAMHGQEHLKYRLGMELDNLDVLSADYDRNYDDIQGQIDVTYERIAQLQIQIGEIRDKLAAMRSGIHSSDNIRLILDHFDRLFGRMDYGERRELCRQLIERIEVFPDKRADGRTLKEIVFRFPIYFNLSAENGRDTPEDEVRFAFDCTKLPKTAAESKATYVELKAYILNNHGFKVSSLYIAQIKRKYGIDMGKNYNLPDDPGKHVPKCPKEKELAIMDALKYFRMLAESTEYKEARGG